MKNQIYQDDEFEQFLQDEVKQHRVYPSDHIWKNIRTQIHGYRAWPALTFISLFIITALTLSTLLNNHPIDHPLPVSVTQVNRSVAVNTSNTPAPVTATEKNTQYFQQIAPEQITAETFADLRQDNPAAAYQDEIVATNAIRDAAVIPAHSGSTERNMEKATQKDLSALQLSQEPGNAALLAIEADMAREEARMAELAKITVVPEPVTEIPAKILARKPDDHTSPDAFFKDFNFISNVPARNRNSKFGFQFYVTPSSSYRRLTDQKVKEIIQPAVAATQNIPLSQNATADINDVVRHKPALGLEIGFGLLYNMTSKLKFKTGLQLNVRQYYIETFQSLTNDLTSLTLINYRGIETINFYSPYNNNTGYRKTQLDNRVYQLSVPIGIQWDVIQGKHIGINAEGSVQPTLALNTNTYLLSTDYKHYTNGNDLIRKWNINTSVGFNITYKAGATLFTVGPQVRYQHLPSYSNLYPIKEYLLDYGIRLGITKQIK